MNLDPKKCLYHCFHPHPTNSSKLVCLHCGTEQGGPPTVTTEDLVRLGIVDPAAKAAEDAVAPELEPKP